MNDQAYPELSVTEVDVDYKEEQPLTTPSETDHQILNKLTYLEVKLDSLNHIFEQRLTYDKDKEKAFELLYSELQAIKENSEFEKVKPFYLDLIFLLDRVENIKGSFADDNLSTSSIPIKNILDSVSEEILEILLRQGVEVIETTPGMLFDPSLQKAIKTQKTSLDSEHNKVFSIIRQGFRYGHRILRPEEVIISKYYGI